MADIELDNLIIRDFKTSSGFQAAAESGEIGENDLSFTPFMPANLWIFFPAWSDHEVDDMSWLCADTFSWHPSEPYIAGYEKLVNAITGAEQKTDTIGDITITYYQKGRGVKVCLPDQESNLVALYETTGIAWYYLLDTTNKQFKLPRTKYGFTGLRDSVGMYVPESLPNITGEIGAFQGTSTGNKCSGAFVYTSYTKSTYGGANNAENANGATFNASRSSSAYKNGAPVQERATQMHLYFYVGNFEQSAMEQTAGLNAEMFNDLNAHKVVEVQSPTSDNGYTWYRKYADGWVEQGGIVTVNKPNANGAVTVTVNLPVEMANGNYYVAPLTFITDGGNTTGLRNHNNIRTTTTLKIGTYSTTTVSNNYTGAWEIKGMAA